MNTLITTDWEALGLSNDFLFGKVMRKPDLCKKLLERIFPGVQIERIEYPETQKTINEDADARSVRLDVYVKDEKDVIYNIEMQTTTTSDLPKRTRYYQSMIDLQLIDKGQAYKKLNRSYIIFICLDDTFKKGRHMYTFENRCREEAGLLLGDGTAKIFLNAGSRMDDVSRELRAFLDYIAGKESDDSFVRELEEAVKEAKRNREWRHEYMTLMMRDQENLEKGREEGRREGLEEGRREGLEEGRREGLEEGHQAGLEEGYAREREAGIRIMVNTLKELGFQDCQVLCKLQEKYKLLEEEAKKYI